MTHRKHKKVYIGAMRAVLTQKGEIAVIFTRVDAEAYLRAQSAVGANIRVDQAIAQAIRAVLPQTGGDCHE